MSTTFVFLTQLTICLCAVRLYKVTQPFDHTEAPTWDKRKGLLYFVDIHAGNVHSYDPLTRETRFIHLDGEVSPVLPSKNDQNLLVLGLNRSVVGVEWDGFSPFYRRKELVTVSKHFPTSRFNDGKADSQGRLWFGTMGFEDDKGVNANEGLLYKITKSEVVPMIAPVNISNGLDWNGAVNKFYYIDTPTRKIMEYDFDDTLGYISNARVVFDFTKHEKVRGFPDGMTVDGEDNLWVAMYGGGVVVKIDPKKGKVIQSLKVPAKYATSVAWGGPNMNILFVTTSRYRLNKEERDKQPHAGSVFAFKGLPTTGKDPFYADILDKL